MAIYKQTENGLELVKRGQTEAEVLQKVVDETLVAGEKVPECKKEILATKQRMKDEGLLD